MPGDHKIRAAAIAKMLNIGEGETSVTGREIEEMDTATLEERVRDVDVFARARLRERGEEPMPLRAGGVSV